MLKRLLSVALITVMLFSALAEGGGTGAEFFSALARDSGAFSRYIAAFSDGTDPESLLSGVKHRLISPESERVYLVETDDISALSAYCSGIEPELVRGTLASDPLEKDRWETAYAGLDTARELYSGSASVVVAVLDTGVERNHEDLAGANILEGFDATAGVAGVYGDSTGHGTAVIGIIAASVGNGVGVAGICADVSVYPVKVASGSGSIYSSDLIAGIYAAADYGADIINISLGGYSYSVAEQNAIDYAVSKGCIIIAAAGNDGADSVLAGRYFYPASYEGVISVASVGPDGSPCRFSQYNDSVDLAAPGCDITVCEYKNGVSSYGTDSGTSYSAAIVSGIAALACGISGGLTCDEFLWLCISELGAEHNRYTGYGSVSAPEILVAASSPVVCGAADGGTYPAPLTVAFSRGSGYLDGSPFASGGTVTAVGKHTLTVIDGDDTVSVSFTVTGDIPTYTVGTDSIVFTSGTAFLDGMPYTSGDYIYPGVHFITLTSESGLSVSDTVSVGGNPVSIVGITDGGVYDGAVTLTVYGDGYCVLDGTSFTGSTVVWKNGSHTAVLCDPSGAEIKTVTFTVNSSAELLSGFGGVSAVYHDTENGYIAVTAAGVNGVGIYSDSDPSFRIRFITTPSAVTGFGSDGTYLYFLMSGSACAVRRSDASGSAAPELITEVSYTPEYTFSGGAVYSGGEKLIDTGLGECICVSDGMLYTTRAVIDMSDGRVAALFGTGVVSVSGCFAAVSGGGLVRFSSLYDFASAPSDGIFESAAAENEYRFSARLTAAVSDSAYDPVTGRVFLLSDSGTLYATDKSFISETAVPLLYVPIAVACGEGKAAVFFESGYCIIDCITLAVTYHTGTAAPEKAVVTSSGAAYISGGSVYFAVPGSVVSYPVSARGICTDGERVFVCNQSGTGIYGSDGSYIGSIATVDSADIFTDGTYLCAGDCVYLISDGSVTCRIPYTVYGMTCGLVFTDGGVFACSDGSTVSGYVSDGVFAGGYCLSADGGYVSVTGSSHAGTVPTVVGADGVYDVSTFVSSDKGVLFIDGMRFPGGEYSGGGSHTLLAVMPFGAVYSYSFSVIPVLTGITVSGGDRKLHVGDEIYIKLEYLPFGASAVPASYSASGSAVTVSPSGLVCAVAEGVSTVTVSSGGFTASVTYTVTTAELAFSDASFAADKLTGTVTVPSGTAVSALEAAALTGGARFGAVDSDGGRLAPHAYVSTGDRAVLYSTADSEIASLTVIVKGDLDCDGFVTASDYRLLSDVLKGNITDRSILLAADCDGNGRTDDSDYPALESLILGFGVIPPMNDEYCISVSTSANVYVGDTLAVVLYSENSYDMDSASVALSYDPEQLELISVSGISYSVLWTDADGELVISAFDPDGNAAGRKIRSFAKVVFRVRETVEQGDTVEITPFAGYITGSSGIYGARVCGSSSYASVRSAESFVICINNAEYFIFNPAIHSYNVTVPYTAVALDIEFDYPYGGSVTCSDTDIPDTDSLTVTVTYVSPEGVTDVYRIHVIRAAEPAGDSESRIGSLTASVGCLNPDFTPERLTYTLSLAWDDPDPEFFASAVSGYAEITADIPISFPVGTGIVTFTCTAQDGTVTVYTVKVIRAPAPDPSAEDSGSESSEDLSVRNGWIIPAAVLSAFIAVAAAVVIIILKRRKEKQDVKENHYEKRDNERPAQG